MGAGGPWGSRASGGSVWSGSGEGDAPPPDETGERYVEPALVGTGGMGRVEAVRDTRLGRVVARKELRTELRADEAARARFEREVRITARLDHPGIVPVFDAGRGPDGTPWYTMRLVRGASLEDALTARDPAGRLALLPRVHAACEAVAAAHAARVVHRDLKPANVMLGPYGETQVVDWGLARELDAADEASAAPAGVIGTPGWMSPEQASGAPADRRSDVYALGRTLAAVISGRCPPDADLADAPPDLLAIVRRATATAPDDRYPDAAALADDLAAWLAGRRVAAYAYPPTELLGRLVRAWRAPITVGAVASVLLVAAITTGWWRAMAERDRALLAEHDLRATLRADWVDEGAASLRAGDLGPARVAAERALELGVDPDVRGLVAALSAFGPRPRQLSATPTPTCSALALAPDGRTLVCATADAVTLWDVGAAAPRWRVPHIAADVARPLSDGPVLLSTPPPTRVLELDPGTGATSRVHEGAIGRGLLRQAPGPAGVDSVRLWRADQPDVTCPAALGTYDATHRDGLWLLPCADGRLRLAGTRDAVVTLPEGALVGPVSAALLADGTALIGTVSGTVVHVDLTTARVLGQATAPRGPVRRLVPSPDGQLVAVSGERMAPRVLALPGLVWVAGLPGRARELAWQDARTLVAAGDEVTVWALDGDVRWGAIAADAGLDGAARGLDGVVTLHDGSGTVTAVAPDGQRLASLRWGEGVVKQGEHHGVVFAAVSLLAPGIRRWDTRTWTPLPTVGTERLRHLAALADDTYVGPRWYSGVLLARADQPPQVLLPELNVGAVVAAASGRWIAVGDPNGLTCVDGETVRWTRPDLTGRAALDADGTTLWVSDTGVLRRLDARDGRETQQWPQHGVVTALGTSDDGALVGLGFVDGHVEVRDATGVLRLALVAHDERISELRFTPEGLLTASWDGTARRWNLDAGLTDEAGLPDRLTTR